MPGESSRKRRPPDGWRARLRGDAIGMLVEIGAVVVMLAIGAAIALVAAGGRL